MPGREQVPLGAGEEKEMGGGQTGKPGLEPRQRLGAGERSLSLWPVLRDPENRRIKAITVKSVSFKTHPPANT